MALPAAYPSVAEWKAELAKVGQTPPDWGRYVDAVKGTCDLDDFDLYVTLNRTGGPSLNTERIGIKYGCPERLDEWDDAITNLGEVTDRVEYLCNTPHDQLPPEDQDEAEAVCARNDPGFG